jgi:hypothetical protein
MCCYLWRCDSGLYEGHGVLTWNLVMLVDLFSFSTLKRRQNIDRCCVLRLSIRENEFLFVLPIFRGFVSYSFWLRVQLLVLYICLCGLCLNIGFAGLSLSVVSGWIKPFSNSSSILPRLSAWGSVEFLQGCLTELRSTGRAADISTDSFQPCAPLFVHNIPVSPSLLILSNFVHPLTLLKFLISDVWILFDFYYFSEL